MSDSNSVTKKENKTDNLVVDKICKAVLLVSGVATLVSVGLITFLLLKKRSRSGNVKHFNDIRMYYGEPAEEQLLNHLEKSFNYSFRVFNASIVSVNGEYFAFGRISNANHDNPGYKLAFSFTLWCKFDIKNMKMLGKWEPLETLSGPVQYPQEPCFVKGIEDVRTFTFRNKLYVIYNTQTRNQDCNNQMFYAPIEITNGKPLLVDNNAIMLFCDELETTKERQKNWGAWVHNDELYFIQSVNNEHVILKCEDIRNGRCSIHSITKTSVKGLRKPLVLASNDKEVLVLTHRAKDAFVYVNVFYTFNANYPHEILRVSEEFQFNKRDNNRDDFEYIMQGFIENDKLYFSGGVNDEVPFFSEIELSHLFSNIKTDRQDDFFISKDGCGSYNGVMSKITCDRLKKR